MLKFLRKKKDVTTPTSPFSVGDEHRLYAIGDIHGRADLLVDLLERINTDHAARAPLPRQIIFLGDLVDRGRQSAQVVTCALSLAEGGLPVRFLKGNHEEVFIKAARGDEKATRFFCRIGGKETILSYGLSDSDYASMDFSQLTDWMLEHIPRDHIDFLDGFEDIIVVEDYAFVHAGIRPDVALDEQRPTDLRWIRDDFLSHAEPLVKFVVHGHTITEGVDTRLNRIGIDTGAYQSGVLTAIGLEGTQRWFLDTATAKAVAAA